MGNEVLGFQNVLIKISCGMDHMSVVKEGHLKKNAKQGK